jgi:DHA3 family macrolide efflux protein-like MFS transporter
MWRHPAIRRLALARFVSRAGGEAAFFVGIWGRAAYELGATPRELALLMAVLAVAALTGSAVAGVLVDRFGPRRVLLAGEVVFAPAALALMLPATMLQMTAVVAVAGFFTAVVFTAITAFPPFLVAGDAALTRANSTMESAGMAAFIAGPALGAVLADTVGLDAIFVLDAATSLVAVALVLGITLQPRPPAATSRARAELADGFRFVYTTPVVRFAVLVGSLLWLSFGSFSALEPLFYRDVLGTTPAALGWVNTVFGVGLLLGALLLPRLRAISTRTLAALAVGNGLGAVVYAGTSSLRVVVVGALAWGIVIGLLMPAVRTLVQAHTPPGLQGRAMGVLQTHERAGQLLPLAVVPLLAAAVGVQRVLVGTGLAVALAAALSLPAATRLRRPVAPPAAPLVDELPPAPAT